MFKHTKRKEQDGNVESNDECNEVIDIIDVESEGGEIDEENVNDTSEINGNDNINKIIHLKKTSLLMEILLNARKVILKQEQNLTL